MSKKVVLSQEAIVIQYHSNNKLSHRNVGFIKQSQQIKIKLF